jgi:acylphosphatase
MKWKDKMMKKLELVIHGKRVVAEDYRLFLLEEASIFGIKGFSATNYRYRNNGKEMIVVKLEGTEEQLEAFICDVRSNFPESAELEEIEQRCIDTYVMGVDRFQMLMETEMWYRFAEAASGNEIGARHLVRVKNES